MCYHTQQRSDAARLKARFQAQLAGNGGAVPQGPQSGFDHPRLPVITAEEPNVIRLVEWGLIPAWASAERAAALANQTLNARAESLFDKPSFRQGILSRRCLVLVDGFFEWQHVGAHKTKYLLTVEGEGPFALAGLWDEWREASTGHVRRTFSIVTTEANPLMARIHNTKRRMPLMFTQEGETAWLTPTLTPAQIKALLVPFSESRMRAQPLAAVPPQLGLFG